MKKIFQLILFSFLSYAAYAQPGSLSQSVYRSRVNDSTTVNGSHPSGYGDIYFNAQRAVPAWLFWDTTCSCYKKLGSGSGGGGVFANQGLTMNGDTVQLGGSAITAASLLNITTGSLSITGTDKPFTVKSTSGLAPKFRIEGDGINTDGRNYEFEPQLISGFIRGLLLKYSTAHNTAANQPAMFVRDNGWIYFGGISESNSAMIYRPNNSLAVGNNIATIGNLDFIQGNNVYNSGTGVNNLLKGQAYYMKGLSSGNVIFGDAPNNGASSMNNMSYNLVMGIPSTTIVQEIASSILFGDDYSINQTANEFQGLYNLLMGNHNVMNNSHHLFQFGTGLVNSYNNTDHGLWKYQPKFYFGNNNVVMGTVKASFVVANGYLGVYHSNSLTHLTNGWTQINTTKTAGFEGGVGTDVDLSVSDVTPKAALEVVSTTSGILFPRMTTTQRDAISSPVNGTVIYNLTTDKLQVRSAGAWVDLH